MLTELHIENFAIIEKLDLIFNPGLVTFTGETGAGKSIIIDAVETLTGGRIESVLVRTGAERANIEAAFSIPPSSRLEIQTILEREGLQDETDILTLGREVRVNGRHIARINGRSVSATLLRELSEFLVDIHGQSEHLSLLKVNQHLGLLDRYAATIPGNSLQTSLSTYQKSYQQYHAAHLELEELCQSERDAARQVDILTYQINEIESAHLQPGEEDSLRNEHNRLGNAEGLANFCQQAITILDEGSPESPGINDLWGKLAIAIGGIVRLDPGQVGLSDMATSLSESMNELLGILRDYSDNIEFNPHRLDQVEERLALIQNLKRKYGESIQAVLNYLTDARIQLDKITHVNERISDLEDILGKLRDQIGQEGLKLSESRHKAAQELEIAVELELRDLQMPGAHFKVDFKHHFDPEGVPLAEKKKVAFHTFGLEWIEFLIAPNPGEGFKPLVKIASGGETSRLMLALKNVLAQADHVPTLIFDEIDQGIGGRVGGIVGQKLQQLSHRHQVFCITHLPQLAAYGEQHFHVEKQVHSGRTTTAVKQLTGSDRERELAQMLGSTSEATLKSAREMLQSVPALSVEINP